MGRGTAALASPRACRLLKIGLQIKSNQIKSAPWGGGGDPEAARLADRAVARAVVVPHLVFSICTTAPFAPLAARAGRRAPPSLGPGRHGQRHKSRASRAGTGPVIRCELYLLVAFTRGCSRLPAAEMTAHLGARSDWASNVPRGGVEGGLWRSPGAAIRRASANSGGEVRPSDGPPAS